MLLLMGGDQCESESDGFETDDSDEGGMDAQQVIDTSVIISFQCSASH